MLNLYGLLVRLKFRVKSFLVKFKFNPGFLTSRETCARDRGIFFIDVHSDDPSKFISEEEFFLSIKSEIIQTKNWHLAKNKNHRPGKKFDLEPKTRPGFQIQPDNCSNFS